MIERRVPGLPRAVNFRQGVVTGPGPGLAPSCFVECRIRLVITVEVAQAQPQIVECFAIARIRISSRQAFDRFTKVRFGLRELATAEVREAQSVVTAGVEWVAPQSFAPVKLGRACGVAVLIKMQPGDVKLIGAGAGRWRR